MFLCVCLLREHLLTTHSTSHSWFKRNQQNLQIKKNKRNQTVWMMQLFHNCFYLGWSLSQYITFYFICKWRKKKKKKKTTSTVYLTAKCFAQRQISNVCSEKNKTTSQDPHQPPKLTTLSHFSLYFRTFYFPLPLFTEGECQEAVEDSPLHWALSTWRILWYDSHTQYTVVSQLTQVTSIVT